MKMHLRMEIRLGDEEVAMLARMYADMVNQERRRVPMHTQPQRDALNRLCALELVEKVRPGRYRFTDTGLKLAKHAMEMAVTFSANHVFVGEVL